MHRAIQEIPQPGDLDVQHECEVIRLALAALLPGRGIGLPGC